MQNNNTASRLDYAIMIASIMVSGNPVFIATGRTEVFLVMVYVFLICAGFLRNKIITKDLFLFIFLTLIIFFYQAYSFDFFSPLTIFGFYIRVWIGFFAFRIVRQAPEVFVIVMYRSAIITLPIFLVTELLDSAGLSIKTLVRPISELTFLQPDVNIVVFNFDGKGEPHRNSGYFWEPGAFAGYLLISLMLLSTLHEVMPKRKYFWYLFILLITLISTKSTTGYLLIPIILGLNYRISNRASVFPLQIVGTLLIIVPVAMLIIVNVAKLSFITDKIAFQIEEATLQRHHWETNRFGNMIADWRYIVERPYFGWGLNDRTRFALDGGEAIYGLGNGLTGTVVKMGFVGLIIYVAYIVRSFFALFRGSWLRVTGAVLCVLLSLNGEQFLNFPIFWGLAFIVPTQKTKR